MIMKNVTLLTVCLFALIQLSFSQDVITLTNGEKINALVIEVSPDLVKYRKFDNQEGPLYSILKKEVYMVKYQNGDKDIFNISDNTVNQETGEEEKKPLTYQSGFWGLIIMKGERRLSGAEVKFIMKDDEEALSKFKGGKTLNAFGSVIGIPSAVVLGYELGYGIASGEFNSAVLIVSGAGFITGIVFSAVGNKKIKQSINIYNAKFGDDYSYNLGFGLTNDGIGFSLRL